jgi:trimethylamine--corrinoid protein Co-methyltransferase
MLTQQQLSRIDKAARDLLEDPGVMMEDEEIRGLLIKRGARDGSKPSVLRIPNELVDEALASAPKAAFLADRRGGGHTAAPDSESRFWTGAAMSYLDTDGFRRINRRELADFSRVIDTLPNVDVIVGTAMADIAARHGDLMGLRTMATNTDKHIRALSFSPRGGEALIEMGQVLAQGAPLRDRPVFSVGFTAHGPLRWTALALSVFKSTSGHRIPCTVNGEPMGGASAPVTLAGTAAVGTAEILAGIVVNQLLEPGRPCLFNLGFAHVMDMRAGFAVTGGPENVLLAVAGAELARYYGLPSVSWMCSDSLLYDSQNVLEKSTAALAHAQARVSAVWGVGSLESEKTLSPVQAVIDDEIIAYVRHYLRGFPVDDVSLAVDEVRNVGVTGTFISTDHTLEHFRSTLFHPDLLVRSQRETAENVDTMQRRAEERVRAILAEEPQPKISENQALELERIEHAYAHE